MIRRYLRRFRPVQPHFHWKAIDCIAQRARFVWIVRRLSLMLCLMGCGAFVPAYSGEPECGRPDALHAIERALCDGSVTVACSCDDRTALECVEGSWRFSHDVCSAGLNVVTE